MEGSEIFIIVGADHLFVGGDGIGGAGAGDGDAAGDGGQLQSLFHGLAVQDASEEEAEVGIAGGGGVHGFHGDGLALYLGAVGAVPDAAPLAQGQEDVHVGVFLPEDAGDRVLVSGSCQGGALYFVKDQIAQLLQRIGGDLLVEGGGIEGHAHASFPGLSNHVAGQVQLVLEHQHRNPPGRSR